MAAPLSTIAKPPNEFDEQNQKRELARQKREDQQDRGVAQEIPEFGGLTGGTTPEPLTPERAKAPLESPESKEAEKKPKTPAREAEKPETPTTAEEGEAPDQQREWGRNLRQPRQLQDQRTIEEYERIKKEREELREKISEEEQTYAKRQLLRLRILQRNLRLARQMPRAAMAMARRASKQGTAQILKQSWLHLIDSWGATLIYINFHFLMAYLGGPFADYFCRFGEEWLTTGAPGGAGGGARQSAAKSAGKSPGKETAQRGEQKTTTAETESTGENPVEETATGESQEGGGGAIQTAGRALEIPEIILFLVLDLILLIIIFLILAFFGLIVYVYEDPLGNAKLIIGAAWEIIKSAVGSIIGGK